VPVYWLEQSASDVAAGNGWLAAGERLCLDRLRFAKRRDDWRLGRWTAKRAVAACLGLPADPATLAKIEIVTTTTGAPEVVLDDELRIADSRLEEDGAAPNCQSPTANWRLAISLSHCSGMALCVVADGGARVGCDLELIDAHSAAFLRDYFTAGERATVDRAPRESQSLLATLLWSAKESAVKALGIGLRLDPRCLEVSLASALPLAAEKTWRESCPVPLPQAASCKLQASSGKRAQLPASSAHLAVCSLPLWRPPQIAMEGTPDFLGWWRAVDGDRRLRTVAFAKP
jgi:4'-phosphopantetheinyl transferase